MTAYENRLIVFFEELPGAMTAYAVAIGSVSLAAILLLAAIHIYTGA